MRWILGRWARRALRLCPMGWRVLRRREVGKLRRRGFERLNFGCGTHPLQGWTNVDGGDGKRYSPPVHPDVIKLDVFDALRQVPDGAVRLITSEHFMEHFTRQDGHRLLREWHRALRRGGVVRIVMPDLEAEVRIYLGQFPGVDWENDVLPHRYRHVGSGNPDPYGKLLEGEAYLRSMLLNNGMHMDGHRYLYDFETIAQSLRLAGFAAVTRVAFGESAHPELRGIDRHDGGQSGRHWIPRIALAVEATK